MSHTNVGAAQVMGLDRDEVRGLDPEGRERESVPRSPEPYLLPSIRAQVTREPIDRLKTASAIFPSLATPGETQQAALSRLFDAAAFAVACAHDGEAAQILALAASPEHVWQRLSDAATSLHITLRDQDR